MKKEINLAIVIWSIVVCFLIAETIATNSGSSDNANLTIWTSGTLNGANLTYGATYGPAVKNSNHWNFYFYANYTNSTGSSINSTNGNGNCNMSFNETGDWSTWKQMNFNSLSLLWEKIENFTYKGNLSFQVNCTSNFGNITNLTDVFFVKNTHPAAIQGISFNSQEDNESVWANNINPTFSDDDLNDEFTYTTENVTSNGSIVENYREWINVNSSGYLISNATRDNQTGTFSVTLKVTDSGDNGVNVRSATPILNLNIQAVNDAPVFVGLENKTFNMSELFEYIINLTDEENNIPFVLNISFINCSTAQWSTRNNTNCTLFTSSQYSFNGTSGILNISFTPSRNDVGSYIINFNVTDNSNLGNKTTSQLVNFTVVNVNSAPYFTYVCDNERNATEDQEFACWVNASDIDEINNLTFFTNYSWFKFNGSSNSITINWDVSSDYNFSAMVNFTPTDLQVGNWSVNMSLLDIGSGIGAPRHNSTVFWFFINNTEDNVSLNEINNQTIYENKTIYVNATDDDLLVPDKNVKNENLTFASNTSWVSVSNYYAPSGTNYTTARIQIDYSSALNNGAGNHTVKINVTDTGGNTAERSFIIRIENDTLASWNDSMQTVFGIYENNLTYLNLSQYVTDTEGDAINFSFTNDSAFPSFNIATTTGIISFTPDDVDVGYHNVTINAYDGKLDSLKSFNFTIYNVNDAPYIEETLLSNINATEDNLTVITLWVQDNDFKIPSMQKSFYNESLTVNLTIIGNSSLFNFVRDPNFPPLGDRTNLSKYEATFTPRKSDVGSYNITINVSDASNSSSVLQFNLTIFSINHAPVLMNLTNHTSSINSNFYYGINATDLEDGDSTTSGNGNFTFHYNFTSGNNIFNATTFNSTTGEINITFNSGQGGSYHINIIVNDSSGAEDSADFWIYVYDYPNVTFPLANCNFNLTENTTANLTFKANHSVGDNLTYRFYIGNIINLTTLRYNVSYYGNNTNLTWQFTPNFTDETYGRLENLTLIVINPVFPNLNTSLICNILINHTNAPVVFSGYIVGRQVTYNNGITINLSGYFSDVDYSDSAYNQTINFGVISNSTPSNIGWNISNWILTLSSSVAVKELITVNATDLNETNGTLTISESNTFEVEFTTPETTPTPTSGGGGGGGTTTPVSLKIILPNPISAYKKDRIVLPITLSNEGKTNLYKINLTAIVVKNNITRRDIKLSFDKSYFPSLFVGKKENASLTVDVNTDEVGLYEITINASVKDPEYHDWGKIYLTVKETNKTEFLEKLLFTEEFIAENPECIEIKEIIKEARKYYEAGNYKNCLEKVNEAIEACKYAIKQPALPRKKSTFENDFYKYSSLTALVLFAIMILYYFYKRIRIKKQ